MCISSNKKISESNKTVKFNVENMKLSGTVADLCILLFLCTSLYGYVRDIMGVLKKLSFETKGNCIYLANTSINDSVRQTDG